MTPEQRQQAEQVGRLPRRHTDKVYHFCLYSNYKLIGPDDPEFSACRCAIGRKIGRSLNKEQK